MRETEDIHLRRADRKCMVTLAKCSGCGEVYEQSKEPLHLINEQSTVRLASDFRRYLHIK